jgi:hypothetical protein
VEGWCQEHLRVCRQKECCYCHLTNPFERCRNWYRHMTIEAAEWPSLILDG